MCVQGAVVGVDPEDDVEAGLRESEAEPARPAEQIYGEGRSFGEFLDQGGQRIFIIARQGVWLDSDDGAADESHAIGVAQVVPPEPICGVT